MRHTIRFNPSFIALVLLMYVSFVHINITFSKRPEESEMVPTHHHYGFGSTNDLLHTLKKITSFGGKNGSASFIVVLAVNYAYRSLALNFVCNLIRLGITNYVIFAMDRDVFDFLASRRVNTFMHIEDTLWRNEEGFRHSHDTEDVFGTRAFVETSIRKSILVLRTLRMGFSVVFSDVDVVWIRNPIPEFLSKPDDFVIQSDRSLAQTDLPLNYKLNSGLYFAKANPRTITAFRAIIKYARAIRRSEQKAFNYVLCGASGTDNAGPGKRVGGKKCMYTPAGTTVSILPSDCFPNGSENKFWVPVRNFAELHPRVVAIHANYIFGRSDKVKRIRRIGFWFLSKNAKSIVGCDFLSQTE